MATFTLVPSLTSDTGIFNLPYPVYTDPSRKIYRALNMTLRTLSGGPKSERGGYLEHNLTLGLARVAQNAIKARMPLYRYPGDFFQVGGEFILGPGYDKGSLYPIFVPKLNVVQP